MKTKYLIISTLLSMFVFISCAKSTTKEIDGVRYKLVRNAMTNNNGTIDAELWEKAGATNYYYTPSLSGKSMIPIMR